MIGRVTTVRQFKGEFWVAGREGPRQPGVLSVGPLTAPVVEVAEPLLSPWRQHQAKTADSRVMTVANFAEEELTAPVTIHGCDDDGNQVTLLDAQTSRWGPPDETGAKHRLQGPLAIVGAHVPNRDHRFTGMRVRLTKVNAWQQRVRQAAWTPEVSLASGRLFAFGSAGDADAPGRPSLWISEREVPPSTLRIFDRSFRQPLISLFTLATDTRCALLATQVQESPGGPWLDVYSAALHSEDEDRDTVWEQPGWLLQPADIDIHHVAAWLDKTELLGPLPAVVADLAHASSVAIDTQVQLLTTVAEGLHRQLYPDDVRFNDLDKEAAEKLGKEVRDTAATAVSSIHPNAEAAVRGLLDHVEEVSYAKRLVRLATVVKDAVPGVTGKTNKWKTLVSDARNDYAHRRRKGFLEDEDVDRYLAVAFSLRWLLAGLLLIQAGASEAVLAQRFRSHEQYMRFLADARVWQPRIYAVA